MQVSCNVDLRFANYGQWAHFPASGMDSELLSLLVTAAPFDLDSIDTLEWIILLGNCPVHC